ncbi:MAG: hypothetical protein ACC628_08215, partial [Pirellulaceae bacterium]
MFLEALERRELLAVGPQLIGIQPNNDALLRLDQTDIRNVAPHELVFKFDENQRFSADDLRDNPGRIQITASGKDGVFAPAARTSDLNTGGAVQVRFMAVRLGEDQNGITINLTKSNQGAPGRPTITVSGKTISVRLNTNPFNESTARDLADAINDIQTNPEASALVVAEIVDGDPDRILATSDPLEPPIPSVVLEGANDRVITPGFIGPAAAPNENEIIVRFAEELPDDLYRIDVFGEHPLLALRNTNRDCTSSADGNLIVGCAFGDLTEDNVDNGVDRDPIFFELDLAPQVRAVVPQPITRDATTGQLQQAKNQIKVYFSDDDLFDPGVVFTGNTLVDSQSVRIEDQAGVLHTFEFDSDNSLANPTARRVIFSIDSTPAQMAVALADAVNTTPNFGVTATAESNRVTLSGEANLTLSPGIVGVELGSSRFANTAENPNFYQLFFTRETVENTDDVKLLPTQVKYDPGTDISTLTFAQDLDQLVDPATGGLLGPGVFRFRVGTDEARPAPPLNVNLRVEASSDFNTGGNVLVRFTSDAQTAEQFGSAIQVSVTKRDQGGPSAPDVIVRGNRILVDLNTNPGNETTAGELVNAINSDGRAAALVTASIAGGAAIDPANEPIANAVENQFTVKLGGLGSSFDTATDLSASFDTGPVIRVIGSGATLVDGQTFTVVDSNGNSQTFEFDNDGFSAIGSQAVPFDIGKTSAEIAAAIESEINTVAATTVFGVQATLSGNGVRLANDQDVTLSGGITAVVLATQGVEISSSIDPQLFVLDLPGSEQEPGHREFSPTGAGDRHIPTGGRDTDSGLTIVRYIFRNVYGTIPDIQGGEQLAFNLITEAEKERAREVFGAISNAAGVTFVETEDEDDAGALIVATGDLRAILVNPRVLSGPGGLQAFGGTVDVNLGSGVDLRTAIIMDSAELWNDQYGLNSDPQRFSWFETAFKQVEQFLGLGNALELPPTTVLGFDDDLVFDNDIEPIYPGDQDIVHLQRLYRPESKDIDLYQFTIDVPAGKAGIFTAETIAERQRNASLLDTVLTLYREIENENGVVVGRELIAQNDDYYSEDSYLELRLGAGTYYVGVSASGNDNYDPVIEDSGFGGTTDGPYDLRLNFRPDADFSIIDSDNFDADASEFVTEENAIRTTQTSLDGNGNGIPGGVYNFWFRTQQDQRVLEVATDGTGFVDGQTITLTNAQGAVRRFEINLSGTVTPGNRAINIAGLSPTGIAAAIATAIDTESGFLISASANGTPLVTLAGERSIELSPGFSGLQIHGKVIYVDKSGPNDADGSLARPFSNLSNPDNPASAFSTTHPGDIVRIVGNDADGDSATLTDRVAYELGFNSFGQPLADGTSLEVPRDVTVMIDAGAVFKMRRAHIGVGSSAPGIDRSAAALQVLGTPDDQVYFTSYQDESIGTDTFAFVTTPLPGEWGGLSFRDDIDRAEGNFRYDEEGIFLNYVNNADIRYGGGNVVIDSVPQIVTPIQIVDARPTIAFNSITNSADAAMSASPNSFEETNFLAPRHQRQGREFTSDYSRIGPDIYGNLLIENSLNGLFVRIRTPAGNDIRKMTVSGRWDDTDIVHILGENLEIAGTPSGPLVETDDPPVGLVTQTPRVGGTLPTGTYRYRLTYVDVFGNEGPVSDATPGIVLPAGRSSIVLGQLPPASEAFVARRLYRSRDGAPFELVVQLNGKVTTYTDDGTTRGGELIDPVTTYVRPRPDARLRVDPSIVVKLDGARIQAGMGAQFIAEGDEGLEIKFTSLLDDRYGTGGTFDTSNDGPSSPGSANEPAAGDWGGIFISHSGQANVDRTLFAFGGGVTRVEGTFSAFNVFEIHQAATRIANSVFENNASGIGGQGQLTNPDRFGRGFNEEGTIFVRGAQPVIVSNDIRDNEGPAININVNALNSQLRRDTGRTTNFIDRVEGFRDNQGPLVHGNRLADNAINGMLIRGQTLTTQSVWDDTDIVHVVQDTIYVPDFSTYGGLRLESGPTESLVVKFLDAGLTAFGQPHEIDDRIGGIIQVIGQPKSPVVLTSLNDDTIGAGFDPQGDVQTTTRGTGDNLQLFQPDSSVAATMTGPLGVSTDGVGTNTTGQLNAVIPTGATVELALLHVATRNGDSTTFPAPPAFRPQTIRFDNQSVPITYLPNVADSNNVNFETGRADVTSIVAAKVALLGGTNFIFDVDETFTGLPNNIEGSGLTVIYSLPGLGTRTVVVLDGGLTGANPVSTSLTFKDPVNPNAPNFVAQMALGISFGQENIGQQFSTVDVNGQRLTSSAGGSDDSTITPPSPGNLITVGGFNDNIGNPVNAASNDTALDDELYDLKPLLRQGATQMRLDFANPTNNNSIFLSVLLLSGEVSVGNVGAPGDWQGILLDQYSHDRNVEVFSELEPRDVISPGINSTTNNAQFLGQLAPDEKGGDENRRLGFEVHGFLNDARDYDVYSFRADAGTEVWFDIDRTTYSLDSVIELINADGTVLARSDNSLDESSNANNFLEPKDRTSANLTAAELTDPSLLFGIARLMQKSPPFAGDDFWTMNPRDAGMRVVLPGPLGSTSTYHVRVRSSSSQLGDLNAGVTSGAYQMQIRLRELDEIAGSTVRYSSIAYATNGIEVRGQPIHSPLLGEAAEETGVIHNSIGTAQRLGNLAAIDRAALSIAGVLSTSNTDVDFYQFDVTFEDVLVSPDTLEMTFDLDYADGLGRANTVISVFDSTGRLILTSREGNIADDRPGTPGSSDIDDLSRGSVGSSDPYIGGVEMPPGTYFVAVTPDSRLPAQLEQFFLANPTNPLLRLEPIDSVRRIADDHIGRPTHLNNGLPETRDVPEVPVLLDAASEVPFNLGDVTLFVSRGDTDRPPGQAFDFGTNSSPVEFGFTPVTAGTPYTNFRGYGWLSGAISGTDFGVGNARTRDVNSTPLGSFAVDLRPYVYTVTLTLGDFGTVGHDQMGIFLEGGRVDTVSTVAGQSVTRTYSIAVADGQLNLTLNDLGGADTNAVIASLEIIGTAPLFAAPDRSRYELYTVDAFTGQQETFVGDSDFDPNTTADTYDIGDIAMSSSGRLFAYSIGTEDESVNCAPRDDNSGLFMEIDTGSGIANVITDDGIVTYMVDPTDPAASVQTNFCPADGGEVGDGIQFNAVAFAPQSTQLFAVGNRGFNTVPPGLPPGPTRFDNILYLMEGNPNDPNFGQAISIVPPAPRLRDRQDDTDIPEFLYQGAGTQIREGGELLTSPRIFAADATLQGVDPNNGSATTVFNIQDGMTYTVEDRGVGTTFEFDFGFEVDQVVDGLTGNTIRDGNFFFLDDTLFQLDTGGVISVLSNGTSLRSKTTITISDSLDSRIFELLKPGDTAAAGNNVVTVNITNGFSPDATAAALAAAINGAGLDIQAFVSPASGRITLVDPTPDLLTGQGGPINVSVRSGNADRSDNRTPRAEYGIRVEGNRGEAPILQAVDGSQLLDGQTFEINTQSTSNRPVVFEFDSGYVIEIPQTFAIQVPFAAGRVIPDGELFTIDEDFNDANPPLVFEMENTDVANGVATGNIPISYQSGSTQEEIADLIAAAVGAAIPT